jgi:spore germination protein KC
MKTKTILLLLLLVNIFVLSGCWNYKDIETVNIVAGVAIDKDKQSDDYILTIEIIDQQLQEGENNAKTQIIEARGVTIYDAIKNGAIIAGEELFWSHSKIIIVSKNIAEEGMIPALDWFMRDDKIRSDIWVAISYADTAGEILKTPVKSNEIVSFYLSDVFNSFRDLSKYISSELITFTDHISSKRICALAPVINITTLNNEKALEISGTSVFKQDKLAYFLNSKESMIVLIMIDEIKSGLLTLDRSDSNDDIKITMEILNCKTKIKPILENDKIIMQIDTKMELSFAEIEGSKDYIKKDQRDALKKDIETEIAEQMQNLISETKDHFSTDVCDFSGAIQRKMPDYWKKIEADWDEIYKTIEIRPAIEIEITDSGNAQKPIEIGE